MTVSRILVGVDGSDGAAQALRWAGELAAQIGAEVVAVHAFEPLAHLADHPPPIDFATLSAEVEARLRGSWTRMLDELGVEHREELIEGGPVDTLLDAAERSKADLIVVGARGLGTLRGLLLGSTSSKLSHLSSLPLVIVPPRPAPETSDR